MDALVAGWALEFPLGLRGGWGPVHSGSAEASCGLQTDARH